MDRKKLTYLYYILNRTTPGSLLSNLMMTHEECVNDVYLRNITYKYKNSTTFASTANCIKSLRIEYNIDISNPDLTILEKVRDEIIGFISQNIDYGFAKGIISTFAEGLAMLVSGVNPRKRTKTNAPISDFNREKLKKPKSKTDLYKRPKSDATKLAMSEARNKDKEAHNKKISIALKKFHKKK